MKKIYIVSPVKTATGGTELLHQLSDKLIDYNKEVYMYYIGEYEGSNVEKRFSNYKTRRCYSIEDNSENLIIVPETLIGVLYRFKNIKKAVWWLSVDFYPGSNKMKVNLLHSVIRYFKDKVNRIYDKKWIHFTQSEYARIYLINDRKIPKENIFSLSDYINKTYIEDIYLNYYERKDIVLYNPKKGYDFTKIIIDTMPNIKWIPLINMTQEQMKSIMLKSKVYIDFGNHPGKDRIPREAALCGCCVITGKKGSAKNNIDVLIPEKYKIEDKVENIQKICEIISKCLLEYNIYKNDFEDYRKKIINEESVFLEDIKNIFLVD